MENDGNRTKYHTDRLFLNDVCAWNFILSTQLVIHQTILEEIHEASVEKHRTVN